MSSGVKNELNGSPASQLVNHAITCSCATSHRVRGTPKVAALALALAVRAAVPAAYSKPGEASWRAKFLSTRETSVGMWPHTSWSTIDAGSSIEAPTRMYQGRRTRSSWPAWSEGRPHRAQHERKAQPESAAGT